MLKNKPAVVGNNMVAMPVGFQPKARPVSGNNLNRYQANQERYKQLLLQPAQQAFKPVFLDQAAKLAKKEPQPPARITSAKVRPVSN